MTGRLLVLLSTCLVVLAGSASGAPLQRSTGGIGLLLIRQSIPRPADEPATTPLYEEPGVIRISNLQADQLPDLSRTIQVAGDAAAAIVTETRSGWLRVVYDAADREGWLRPQRNWCYLSWDELLPGRWVQPASGLNADTLRLYNDTSGQGAVVAQLKAGQTLVVLTMSGPWLEVVAEGGQSGWLRWRDADRRLLIRLSGDPLDCDN